MPKPAATGDRIRAGLYGALAGIALVDGVVQVVERPQLGPRLLLVDLALSMSGQALILCATVLDDADVLDGGGRIIGQPRVALAAIQLTAIAWRRWPRITLADPGGTRSTCRFP